MSDDAVAALAAGEPTAREALAHLEQCDACRMLVSAACAHRTGGTPEHPGERIAAGTLLGRYRIERPLGTGGMGVVYLARDPELERDVAVKLLHADDERAHVRLLRESQALARLNHPNVVTVHEVGRHGTASYLIMEHVTAGTVREWVAAARRTPAEIAAVYAQAARGLAAAHAAGLVHRDLKPDNVLVGSDGRARISDFGLAGGSGQAEAGVVVGTPGFIAPEVAEGGRADPRSDQWSLCASLRATLGGAAVPAWLRAVLERGLDPDPARRFPTSEVLANALARSRRVVRNAAIAAAAAAAIVVVIGGVGYRLAFASTASDCSAARPAWSALDRVAITSRFATLGDRGVATARLVVPILDGYGARWREQRVAVCNAETGEPAGRIPELRAACLDSRRVAFAALVDGLRRLDATTLPNALAAANDLPALDDCEATERLAGRQPLPAKPADRAAVAALSAQYAAARTRGTLGDRREAVATITRIADAAERLGYFPLVADTLGYVGRAQALLLDAGAVPVLRRAHAAALAGADDHQILDAILDLLGAAIDARVPVHERDELRAQAGALAARFRWRGDPIAEVAAAHLALMEGNDDIARADLAAGERELRAALAAGARAFGPRDARLANIRQNLVALLLRTDRPDEAATLAADALQFEGTWAVTRGGLEGLSNGPLGFALLETAEKLETVGRDDQAQQLVEQIRHMAGHEQLSAIVLAALDDIETEVAVARGDVAAARRFNASALARLGGRSGDPHAAALRASGALIDELAGDPRTAARELEALIPQLAGDHDAVQGASFALARCLAAIGERDRARELLEHLLTEHVEAPRDAPPAWLLLATLRWDHGQHDAAIAAARAGRDAVAKLPALIAVRGELDAWLAAH